MQPQTTSFITGLVKFGEATKSRFMKINPNAPVVQFAQIQVQANPEAIWAVLSEVNNWPNWNNKISNAKMENQLAIGARFTWIINGARIKSTLHTATPGQALGWSGTTFGATAIHNWYFQEKDGGTLVSVEESMEGWLVSLFKSKMNRDLANDMQHWLKALKVESEKK